MQLLAIAAAVVLAAPSWNAPPIGPEDYPAGELADQKSAGAVIALLVGPDGEIQRCDLVSYRGDAGLARKTCMILRRKRMQPARNSQGAPALGVYTDFVSLYVPYTPGGAKIAALKLEPEMQIVVNSLPAGAGSSLDFDVAVEVDASGVAGDCAGSKDAPGGYGRVACNQIIGKQLAIVADVAGKPAATVRKMKVRFALGNRH